MLHEEINLRKMVQYWVPHLPAQSQMHFGKDIFKATKARLVVFCWRFWLKLEDLYCVPKDGGAFKTLDGVD